MRTTFLFWPALVLPLLACGSESAADPQALKGLYNLQNVEELQAQFNQDVGKLRIYDAGFADVTGLRPRSQLGAGEHS